MAVIELETIITSNIETCFDLARSIDLHQISTAKTNEIAIDGKIKGLIELNEFITWQAKHFGITQKLTSQVTAFDRPFHFRDEQLKGVQYIIHNHYFKTYDSTVIMKDVFRFQSPLGFVGKLIDRILLKRYLQNY